MNACQSVKIIVSSYLTLLSNFDFFHINYIKSLNIPVICFPKGIKNYKEYCQIVKPDAICIDYNVNPNLIRKEINIPVQGGMDPKILLTDKINLK